MKGLRYLALAGIFLSIQGTPSCTFHKDHHLLCVSDNDTDFELKRGLVSDNNATESVTLTSCGLSSLKCKAFFGLPSLKSLDLSANRIQTLHPCIFQGLDQLTHLNLSNNRLEQFAGALDAVGDIEVLHLNGNKLKTFPHEAFDNLSKLTELNLANNELNGAQLNPRMFERTKRLTHLNLTRNDLSGVSEMLLSGLQSLQVLILDRCFLTEVPSFATRENLKTVKHLSLNTNLISNLNSPTTFVNLDDLEILDLNGNAIESVHENVFAPLKKVKTIYLRRNRLINIPDKLFQNLPKLVNVDLGFNAIEKIQTTPFKNSPMKNLNLAGNRLSYLPENFCHQLINEGGRLTKFLFSHNPWQCACLRDIIEEVKALQLVYNRDKYSGHNAVCVSGPQFTCVRN